MINISKVTISVTIDKEVAEAAKKELFGEMSSICETALFSALKLERRTDMENSLLSKFKGVPAVYIKKIKKTIETNMKTFSYDVPEACAFWAGWLNEKCNTKITGDDIENFVIRKI